VPGKLWHGANRLLKTNMRHYTRTPAQIPVSSTAIIQQREKLFMVATVSALSGDAKKIFHFPRGERSS
jgi:hypothetical protein